jgi:iron(III) transport system permease protein
MTLSKSGRHFKTAMVITWASIYLFIFATLIFLPSTLAGSASTSEYGWSQLFRFAGNSIYTAGFAAIISVAWSFLPALTAARRESGPGRTTLSVITCLPLFIAPAVIAVVAVHLFGARGLITDFVYQVLEGLNISDKSTLRVAPIFTLTGTALVLATAFYPVSYLVNLAVLQRINPSVEDAGLLETSQGKMYLRLLIPMIRGGLFVGGILVFLLSINEFSIPESLRAQPVLVSQVYTLFGVFYDGRAASFAALLLIGCSFFLLFLISRFLRGEPIDEAVDHPSKQTTFPTAIRVTGWVLALIPGLCILGVLLTTVNGPEGVVAVLNHVWTQYHSELFQSLKVAGLAAVFCLGTGWAWGLLLSKTDHPWPFRLLLLIGFVLPGPIIGLALKMIMLLPPGWGPEALENVLVWLDGTLLPLLFAHTLKFTPVVALLVEYQLRRAPVEFSEAVILESQSQWDQLLTWKLHSILPALFASGVAVFALCLSELGTTILLIPPGETTLSVSLMTLMHYAPTSHVSALCLMLTLPSLVIFLIVFLPLMLLMLGKGRRN